MNELDPIATGFANHRVLCGAALVQLWRKLDGDTRRVSEPFVHGVQRFERRDAECEMVEADVVLAIERDRLVRVTGTPKRGDDLAVSKEDRRVSLVAATDREAQRVGEERRRSIEIGDG